MKILTQSLRPPAPRAPAARAAALPSRALLLAATVKMPYRTLQCLTEAGLTVYALGGRGARGLKFSRRVAEFIATEAAVDGTASDALVADINAVIARLGIDIVIAGDAQATRSLIAMRERLAARSFPMPTLDTFDWLNDKWRFYDLCLSLGVQVPKSQLFETVTDLRRAFDTGELASPKIAKPLSITGSEGGLRVDPENASERLAKIDYKPIIVQEFIEGEDIGASALCEEGRMRALIVHRYGRNVYESFRNSRVRSDIEKIAWATSYDGICNFDMRVARDGQIFYLGCNPRIFLKVAMSMLAGVDFLALGLGRRSPVEPIVAAPTAVRLPKALLTKLWAPWSVEPQSWRALKMTVTDPVPYIREELGLEEDRRPLY